ncbi:MAG: recombinase family protein [Cyanophyceae cyanobacterium]
MTGPARSGKTQALLDALGDWLTARSPTPDPITNPAIGILALAAPGGSRPALDDRLTPVVAARSPLTCTTPMGWAQAEVQRFYPWLAQTLGVSARPPILLRSENEQELAAILWAPLLESLGLAPSVAAGDRAVRQLLDWYQLAASAGLPCDESLGERLIQGFQATDLANQRLAAIAATAIAQWRGWCLGRGLLTYGLATELYYGHLLPQGFYRDRLRQRFGFFLADDGDDYPGAAADLLAALMDCGIPGAIAFGTDGAVRLGLGADPDALSALADRCTAIAPAGGPNPWSRPLAERLADFVLDPGPWLDLGESLGTVLPDAVGGAGGRDRLTLLSQPSRLQLLQGIADQIALDLSIGHAAADIAIIAPGLDYTARHILSQCLAERQIPLRPLNVQDPLIERPPIRALMTLLALVYAEDLGRLIDPLDVAQLLVTLSRSPRSPQGAIDPVRAGLLVDTCFDGDRHRPRLLPPDTLDRWDCLGHRAFDTYERLRTWIETRRDRQDAPDPTGPLQCLEAAIADFLRPISDANDLHDLQELLEAAHRHWAIATALDPHRTTPAIAIAGRFIRLMQRGAITANPLPASRLLPATNAITLATIFQYRISHQAHRIHYWLDISSPLWLQGGSAVLTGADLLLRSWDGTPTTAERTDQRDRQRLARLLRDLLARCRDRLILCHSDLATNGQEPTGPLRPLVESLIPTP